MYRYKIKEGAESRTFGGDGVRNLGNGVVESDHALTSPYLTILSDDPDQPQRQQTPMTATPNPAPVRPSAPVAAVTPPAAPENEGGAS